MGAVDIAVIVKEVVKVDEGVVGVEGEDVVPGSRKVVAVGEGSDGGEGVVEDGMVARGDFAGADIEDERDEG